MFLGLLAGAAVGCAVCGGGRRGCGCGCGCWGRGGCGGNWGGCGGGWNGCRW